MYRGAPPEVPAGALDGGVLGQSGVDLISVDGPTRVLRASAWEVLPANVPSITLEEEAAAVAPLALEILVAAGSVSNAAGLPVAGPVGA